MLLLLVLLLGKGEKVGLGVLLVCYQKFRMLERHKKITLNYMRTKVIVLS